MFRSLKRNSTLVSIFFMLAIITIVFAIALMVALNAYEAAVGSIVIGDRLKPDDPTLATRAAFGQFGDFIGGIVNPIIGFFTAVFVMFSLIVTTLDQARVRFETTFFLLMSEFDSLKAATHVNDYAGKQHHGSDAFTQICFKKFQFENKEESLKKIIDLSGVQKKYPSFYRLCEEDLGPYFRMVYRILRYIDEAPGGSAWQRNFFAGVLRAKLSKSELWLLTLNALSNFSEGNMKPLIERYRMLQHLPNTVYETDLRGLKREFATSTFE